MTRGVLCCQSSELPHSSVEHSAYTAIAQNACRLTALRFCIGVGVLLVFERISKPQTPANEPSSTTKEFDQLYDGKQKVMGGSWAFGASARHTAWRT